MVKKKGKTTRKKEKCNCGCNCSCGRSVFCRPTTWIIALLALVLLVISGLSLYGFESIDRKNSLQHAELATFPHLAKQYIREMDDFTVWDQQTIRQATGYGVSDEDGVLYITFDYALYPEEGTTNWSYDDLDFRHAILYFQYDAERNTFGHAFGYYDDASYHPDGTYVKFEEKH